MPCSRFLSRKCVSFNAVREKKKFAKISEFTANEILCLGTSVYMLDVRQFIALMCKSYDFSVLKTVSRTQLTLKSPIATKVVCLPVC